MLLTMHLEWYKKLSDYMKIRNFKMTPKNLLLLLFVLVAVSLPNAKVVLEQKWILPLNVLKESKTQIHPAFIFKNNSLYLTDEKQGKEMVHNVVLENTSKAFSRVVFRKEIVFKHLEFLPAELNKTNGEANLPFHYLMAHNFERRKKLNTEKYLHLLLFGFRRNESIAQTSPGNIAKPRYTTVTLPGELLAQYTFH